MSSLFNTDLESRILELAAARGFLQPALGPREPLRDDDSDLQCWGPKVWSLVETGALAPAHLRQLVVEVLQTPTYPPPPEWNLDYDPIPQVVTWKGYEDLQLLDTGAQGRVYKARDPNLDRWVALKFPRGGTPDRVVAVLKEASLQAQVVHPNVLKVLEVGEHDGQPFIALQYIADGHLGQLATRLTMPQRVRLMARVAEGLHAAHRAGLLHLDIQPSNILVDLSSQDEPWPYLTDFGLVRREADAMAGHASLPAPVFASPGLMAGKGADRRTDIFALGATLHFLVAGTDTYGPLAHDASGVPVFPKRDVPRDLQAIITKCMAPNPADRYASARAVALDLNRYLEGKPVLARKPTFAYRSWTWMRRNRAITTLAACGCAGLLVIGVWSAVNARRRALQLRLADQYSREVQGVEQQLRLAHMARIHDRRGAVAQVRATMASIERDMRVLGRGAFAPGSYALGAGHETLGNWDEARLHLEAAWNAGFRTPPCARALGEVLAWHYHQGKAELQTLPPDQRAVAEERLDRTFRKPALAAIAVARAEADRSPHLDAMVAYLNGDLPQALAQAQLAVQRFPWLYEMEVLQMDIHMELMWILKGQGKTQEARAKLKEARVVLERSLEVAPSDPMQWVRGFLIYWNLASEYPDDPMWGEKARQSVETAVRVDPEHVEANGWLALHHISLAEKDAHPMPHLDRALQAAEASHRFSDPRHPNNYLGLARGARGKVKLLLGMDAQDDLDGAIASLDEARDRGDKSPYTLSLLQEALTHRGRWTLQTGADPLPFFKRAIEVALLNSTSDPGNLRWRGHHLACRLDLARAQRLCGLEKPTFLDELVTDTAALLAGLPEPSELQNLAARLHAQALLERLLLRPGSRDAETTARVSSLMAGHRTQQDPDGTVLMAELGYCVAVQPGIPPHAVEPLLKQAAEGAARLAKLPLQDVRGGIAGGLARVAMARQRGLAKDLKRELDQLQVYLQVHPHGAHDLKILVEKAQTR